MQKWVASLLIIAALVSFGSVMAQPDVINNALAALNTELGTSLTLQQLDDWSWSEQRFNDASLGCPQPGMSYAAVVTRGYIFLLTYNGFLYDYRSDEAGNVFLCSTTAVPETEATPVPVPTSTPAAPTGDIININTASAVREVGRVTYEPGTFGSPLVWTADGVWIAAAGRLPGSTTSGGAVLLFDAADLNAEPLELSTDAPVTALDSFWGSDGVRIIFGDETGAVGWMSAESPEIESTMESPFDVGAVQSVAISPNGRYIAAAYGRLRETDAPSANVAQLWDAGTGSPLLTLEHTAPVSAVAFSPDSTTLVTGDAQGFLRLWDTVEGSLLLELRLHRSTVRDIAYSPNGNLLASGSDDGVSRIWKLDTESLVANFDNVTGDRVYSVTFSPDGLMLATTGGNPDAGTRDNSIRLWDINGFSIATSLTGHQELVSAVAFSPEGLRLASVSVDGTLRVWGVAEPAG